jgi:hypothetical protein
MEVMIKCMICGETLELSGTKQRIHAEAAHWENGHLHGGQPSFTTVKRSLGAQERSNAQAPTPNERGEMFV